ncbi:MAG: DUF6680 family protein [Sphingopyxis sp.]
MSNVQTATAWGFSAVEAAIIVATIAGPILAVQAQKWLERGREVRERRTAIFRTLMATRSAVLSPEHVQALNAIPVEFYGSKGRMKSINDAWKLFLDHHVPGVATTEAWWQKRQDLFLDLLHMVSEFLGYDFSRAQLSRDIYSPQAHSELENEQTIIRKGLVKLFNGEAALPMVVTEFPATAGDDELASQAALQKLLTEWLKGQRAVKVEQQSEKTARGKP